MLRGARPGRARLARSIALRVRIRSAVRAREPLSAEAGTRAAAPFPTPLSDTPFSPAASILRFAPDRLLLTKPNTLPNNRVASVATLRWCSGSSRNGVRLPFGTSVQLRRNPHSGEETYTDLRHLAESILPNERRPSMYEIPPFDASLHESSGGVFEILAAIRFEYRHRLFDPVDACEEGCLKEMCLKLTDLGVSTGHRQAGN
jgi:hypothetical protein